jgi:hypothetical protein
MLPVFEALLVVSFCWLAESSGKLNVQVGLLCFLADCDVWLRWLCLLAILIVYVVYAGWLCWLCFLILLAMMTGYDACLCLLGIPVAELALYAGKLF